MPRVPNALAWMIRVVSFAGVALLTAVEASAQCAPPVQRLVTDGKYDEARVELQAQLKRAANDDAAMNCLGRLLIEQGDSGNAIDWLEKALKINGKSPQHHLWLANALRAEVQHANKLRQPFIARRMKAEYEQAIALEPDLVDAHHGLFVFFANAPGFVGGSLDKARAEAAVIMTLNPMRGHIDYGFLADKDNDFPGAEKEFLAAIAAAPDRALPYNAAGTFYRLRQRWTEATAMFEKSLKATPAARDAAIAHHGLGAVHQQAGRRDEARVEFQAALAVNPNYEDAKRALAALK